MGNAVKTPRTTIRRVGFLVILGMAVVPASAWQQSWLRDEQALKTHAVVTGEDAGAPLGKFLLMRNGSDLCAVKITAFRRGHDDKPSNPFNSGAESFYAEYDWFYQADGTGDMAKENVKHGHRTLTQKRTLGIGRLTLFGGPDYVRCGPFVLLWMPATRVAFWVLKGGIAEDSGIQMAPTKWSEIGQVKPNDPTLKWYRLEYNRKLTYIPLADL